MDAKDGAFARGLRVRDLAWAGAAALIAGLVYAFTACRTIFTGDSPELAAAAACFGVPHPPGYPLYTLLTGLWVHLFPLARRAFAANLASGLHAAFAVGLLFLLLRRMKLPSAACLAGAAVIAFGRSAWSQAVAAEVYAFDLLLLAGAALAIWVAMETATPRVRFVAGLVVGLWIGHRFLNLVYLPGLCVLARAARAGCRVGPIPHAGSGRASDAGGGRARPGKRTREGQRGTGLTWRAWSPWIGGLAVSWLPFLYLPLASLANPAIDIGDPQTLPRFLAVVRGAPYARHLQGTTAALAIGRVGDFFADLPWETGFGLLLAILGIITALRRGSPHRGAAAGLLLLLVTNLAISSPYNILDIASYRLPGALGLAGLAAFGAQWLLDRAGSRRNMAAVALPALVCLLVPINFRTNDLHANDAARRLGEHVFASAEGNALLLVEGDTVTHAVWYLQAVEQFGPGVMVLSTGHASAWYLAELARRFPGEGIPSLRDGDPPGPAYLRLLESVSLHRPVSFAFDPGRFAALTPGAWWGGRTIVPVGMNLEARRKEQPFDRDSLALADAALWRRFRRELPRIDAHADLETRVIGLEYALGILRSAEFLQRRGLAEESRELFQAVLDLQPGRWDTDLAAGYRKIGRVIPPLNLEERARRALEALDTPVAPAPDAPVAPR